MSLALSLGDAHMSLGAALCCTFALPLDTLHNMVGIHTRTIVHTPTGLLGQAHIIALQSA